MLEIKEELPRPHLNQIQESFTSPPKFKNDLFDFLIFRIFSRRYNYESEVSLFLFWDDKSYFKPQKFLLS